MFRISHGLTAPLRRTEYCVKSFVTHLATTCSGAILADNGVTYGQSVGHNAPCPELVEADEGVSFLGRGFHDLDGRDARGPTTPEDAILSQLVHVYVSRVDSSVSGVFGGTRRISLQLMQ